MKRPISFRSSQSIDLQNKKLAKMNQSNFWPELRILKRPKLVIAEKKQNEHLHRTNSLENKMTKWNSRSWFEGRQLLLLLSVLAKRLNSCENSDPLESRNDQQILSTTATTSTTATATTAGPGPRSRPRQRQELQRWLPVGREHPERLGKVEAAAVVSKVRPPDVDEIERVKAKAQARRPWLRVRLAIN